MSNTLILGGSGFVGRSLCARLVGKSGGGDIVAVPSRRPARAKHIQVLPGVQLIEADVHDEDGLAELLAGRDAVVNLVAILHGTPQQFQSVHAELPAKLARACARARVRRIVQVSALGVAADAPSHYLRSKAAGEAALKASGLAVTLLRPSVIFGEHDRFLNLFASLQRWFPVLPLAGADARFQPVWVEDVAAAIVRCLDDVGTAGQTYECAGPTVYTLANLARLAGRMAGCERPVVALPDTLARLQALAMEMLPGEPLMSRDNLDSMRAPNVASAQAPGLAALGIAASAIEAIAPHYLGGGEGTQRLNPLRARAGRS